MSEDQTREYPGTVEAAQRSDMAFEVSGRIEAFLVQEGDEIQEGDLLARLDPRNFQAQLDKAIADKNAAQADFARYEQAYNDDAVTRQDLDLARRNLEVSLASLRAARKQFDDTELRAPFAGVVAQKLVRDFANIQAKQAVLVVQDVSSLEMSIAIPEQDVALARTDLTKDQFTERLEPKVEIPATMADAFGAYVKSYETTADPVTRTYNVTLGFDAPDDVNVTPGMTGKVLMRAIQELGSGAPSTIPAQAVAADADGNAYVWTIRGDDMTVAQTPVEVGELTGADISIRSGLAPGTRIATSGVHNLRPGMQVRELD